MAYKPPFTISERTVGLVADIMEMITRLTFNDVEGINPRLRRDNRLKTIQASLAIENNSLTLNQVTDIVNGKRVLGPQQDIAEVQNAYQAYEVLLEKNPYSIKSMLQAHKLLMTDLTSEAGIFRSGGVGIFAGEQLIHMAPPAEYVTEQIESLIGWAESSEVHPLIKSWGFRYVR